MAELDNLNTVLPNLRGGYSASDTYRENDVVAFNGELWIIESGALNGLTIQGQDPSQNTQMNPVWTVIVPNTPNLDIASLLTADYSLAYTLNGEYRQLLVGNPGQVIGNVETNGMRIPTWITNDVTRDIHNTLAYIGQEEQNVDRNFYALSSGGALMTGGRYVMTPVGLLDAFFTTFKTHPRGGDRSRICITDDNRAFEHDTATNSFTLVGTGIRETDGNLWAIGTDGVLNYRGTPPNSGLNNVTMFTPIPAMTNIRSVFTGANGDETFIIQNPISPLTETSVFVTGDNGTGQLGLGNTDALATIVSAPLLANAYKIGTQGAFPSVGYVALIGDPSLASGAQVVTWNVASGLITPTPISFLNNVRDFSVNNFNAAQIAFFLRIDGTVACYGRNFSGSLGIGNTNDIPMTSVAVPVGPFQGTVIGVRTARLTTVLWTATQLYVAGFYSANNFGGDRLYSDDRQSITTASAPTVFTLALTTTEQIVNVYVVEPANAIMVHLASGLTLISGFDQPVPNFPSYAYRTSEDISGDAASVPLGSLGFQEVKL